MKTICIFRGYSTLIMNIKPDVEQKREVNEKKQN
jgi:hypothetical protein